MFVGVAEILAVIVGALLIEVVDTTVGRTMGHTMQQSLHVYETREDSVWITHIIDKNRILSCLSYSHMCYDSQRQSLYTTLTLHNTRATQHSIYTTLARHNAQAMQHSRYTTLALDNTGATQH